MASARPYRVEARIDEPGEQWKVVSTHATPEAAEAKRDEHAATFHQLDVRVVNRDEVTA